MCITPLQPLQHRRGGVYNSSLRISTVLETLVMSSVSMYATAVSTVTHLLSQQGQHSLQSCALVWVHRGHAAVIHSSVRDNILDPKAGKTAVTSAGCCCCCCVLLCVYDVLMTCTFCEHHLLSAHLAWDGEYSCSVNIYGELHTQPRWLCHQCGVHSTTSSDTTSAALPSAALRRVSNRCFTGILMPQ